MHSGKWQVRPRPSLRCVRHIRAASWSGICAGNLGRKRFSIGPDGAIFEVLLLPDGDRAFERVNSPSTCVECSPAMGRNDYNQHARFTDFDAPEAVNDGQIANLKLLQRLRGKVLELLKRHFFICLVIQIERAPTPGLVPYDAFEYHRGAVFS